MQAELTQIVGAPMMDVFGPIAGFSGHFSIESALVLLAFAMAGLLRRGLGRWGIAFLVIGLATVFNTVLEISYGLTFFNGGVAAFSLLAMGSAAIATLTSYIHRPIVRVLFVRGGLGRQTRIMALAALMIHWVGGLFLHSVREFGPTAAPYEAVVVSVIAWSMLIILVLSAAHLETSDVARRRAERALLMVKRIDPLTKTLNRFGMSEKLETAWAEFKGGGAMFGMLMLDGDYFRRINDTFGHGVGDGVLERVAATLQPQLRDHDALGRWSGEEFLILLKIKAQRDLDVVAGRLRNALKDVNSPFPAGLDGEPMSITASFGISEMRENDDTPADTLMRADAALHMAKDAGQDHIVT